ncbi:MAG: 50S ribosomal protein L3 [Verrucomicrobia bacterium]|nr:50S ribosomal protein L3 [Verrucomicrobiota bacterium]
MVGLLGKKLGQTRVFDEAGNVTPVTAILAGPNYVLQVKTVEKDGYNAVQLGFDEQKPQRLTKPLLGHIKKWNGTPVRRIREFRDFSLEVKPGDKVGPALFEPGDYVDAIGYTKGRGFQGVVKRWNFGGGTGSHGTKGWHRRPGAIGQRLTPGTVRKGIKMPGHMGQVRRTVQNLEVVKVIEEENLLLVKGAVPGAVGDYVVIREAKKIPKAAAKAKREALRKEAEEKAAARKKGR